MYFVAMRFVIFTGLALVFSGCVMQQPGDPLEDVDLLSDVDVAPDADAASLTAAPASGLFSDLFGGSSATAQPDADAAATEDGAATRGGLFGFLQPAAAGGPAIADPDEVAPRTPLPFGELGKTCGLSRGDLGTRVASASGYEIYDTIPNSTAPRPHYITGFSDRCARQFTAALVLMGDVGTHEVVRYSRTGVDLDYSVTDNAYEAIKAGFCRVGHGQPCGAKLERLARRTTFVTAYQSFGSSSGRVDILLHDGAVAAVDRVRR